jgi:hypothetical protein
VIEIENGQPHDHGETGQDEQEASQQSAGDAAQQPARIGCQLHGFRPRKQHAEIERMQEPRLVEPAAFLDQLPVHQRNLPCWTAEGKKPDAAEDAKQFRP